MVIALLVLLGVDLVLVAGLAVLVLGRKRWVRRQSGAFAGAIRVADGELDEVGSKWCRGYGRWVRDVLVWTRAPFLFRNTVLPADGLDAERRARKDEVKRLGDEPIVLTFAVGDGRLEVAVRPQHRTAALAPFAGAETDPSGVPAAR
jgi:hypothetical protein